VHWQGIEILHLLREVGVWSHKGIQDEYTPAVEISPLFHICAGIYTGALSRDDSWFMGF
jgi:hypothetical protein